MDKLPEPTHVPSSPAHTMAANPRGPALWMRITLAQRLLNIAAQRFWTHPSLPRIFPGFLLELHSMVRCSVPLMCAAQVRAAELAPTDPLAAITATYLQQHIEEEAHHDEWLLNDLVAAGMERSTVLRRAPSANVAQLVGAQYRWIRHSHPAALFGYLAVIEGNPPLAEHLNQLPQQTGFPHEAFRCLHLHAADDIEHLRELRNTITGLPLSTESAALIATSAFATLHGLIAIFEDLVAGQEPVAA